MSLRNALLSVALLGQSMLFSADVRVLKLDGTALFPKGEPLRQLVMADIANDTAAELRCQVAIRMDGGPTADVDVVLPRGTSRQKVLVPDIQKPANMTLQIRDAASGAVLAEHEQIWQPQRHWTIYLVKSTHEDLGYDDYIQVMRRDLAGYIDEGRRLSGTRENMSVAERNPETLYHYTMENLWFQSSYIEERGEAAWREVVEKDLKTGRMHLMGAPTGVHSHWMDYEELARMTYPGRRETRDRFGLDLKTFMMVDNPSLSWSGAQALADAGFKYVARWGQGWRTGGNNNYQKTKLPAVFWWQAPDRRKRVLFAWSSSYADTLWLGQPARANLVPLAAEELARKLKSIESGQAIGPYPYDALISPGYDDHGAPHLYRFLLPTWVSQYRYPQIRIAGPTEFFDYMESKYANEMPVLAGDLNNFSADYTTIDPDSQSQKRRAARLLPLAEGLGAIASGFDPSFFPPSATIRRAFNRLMEYDEHCWPTLIYSSDVQQFNTQWVKTQNAVKSLDEAQQSVAAALSVVQKEIPTGARDSVMVFNPLGHRRTDLVEIAGSFPSLVDAVTGRPVPTQVLGGGKTLFVASDVPSFGYKVFQVAKAGPGATSTSLQAGPDFLSNRFYRIQFDPKTGVIASILDKETNRELVDPAAKHKFNQFLYVETKTLDSPEARVHSTSAVKSIQGRVGAVKAEMVINLDDPLSGAAITQTITLYEGLKRIDIVNGLQHVRSFWSKDHAHRYRANIFFAFPVQVQDFQARAEYPGGVVRPYDDQLRWGSHDYLLANRWVDVSNSKFGVTMAPWNAQAVHFGEIRYNRFSIDYKPSSPHLYSYAFSNRMGDLIATNPEEFNATIGYSFTSHAGDWDSGATTRFGWAVASPLEARVLPAGQKGSLPPEEMSFLSIDAPNVQLVTLKQSEQPGRGWIVRLVETDGKAATVTVSLPSYPVAGAMRCDLIENDLGPLATAGRTVKLDIGPHAFATLRVFGPSQGPAKVIAAEAQPLSDSRIRLSWKGAPGAAYNVYRSAIQAAPPTAYTLVARTTIPEFVDAGLQLDSDYFYYVAAVDASNQQGPLSEQARARTSLQNASAPSPVEDLGVVRASKDRLIVYWHKSPDPDVARFHVYRGEHPDFQIAASKPIAVIRPSGFFLETHPDTGLQPGKTYYYKVLAEDWAGNRQVESAVAHATTPVQ